MVTASTPVADQGVGIVEGGAAERAGDEIAALAVRIGDADQLDARQLGEHAGVVRTHHADADDADAQYFVGAHFLSLTHDPMRPLVTRSRPHGLSRSMPDADWRRGCGKIRTRFDSEPYGARR